MGISDIFNNQRARRIGAKKARRDIELVKAFLAEHGDNPPADVAKRFFVSLDRDNGLDRNSLHEKRAYAKLVNAFQHEYAASLDEDVLHIFGNRDKNRTRGEYDINLRTVELRIDEGTTTREIFDMILEATNGDVEATNEIMDQVLGQHQHNAEPVSETSPSELSLEEKLNRITRIRAQLDQLKASSEDTGGLTDAEQAQLDVLGEEIVHLARGMGIQGQ